jgi:hypothetical protein
MLDAENNIKFIPVLDFLWTINPITGLNSHAEALTGKININIEGAKVNELEIY